MTVVDNGDGTKAIENSHQGRRKTPAQRAPQPMKRHQGFGLLDFLALQGTMSVHQLAPGPLAGE